MRPDSILALDPAGIPDLWIDVKTAALHYVTEEVEWEAGETYLTLHGGIQAATGIRSELRINSIVAIASKEERPPRIFDAVPALTRQGIFRRDRYVCAYCAERYPEKLLEVEHILPVSRGGKDTWMNLVAACKACNDRKGARLPEEAGMPLCYVPYQPNLYEGFILNRRRILADQMEFLLRGVGKGSRLRS